MSALPIYYTMIIKYNINMKQMFFATTGNPAPQYAIIILSKCFGKRFGPPLLTPWLRPWLVPSGC